MTQNIFNQLHFQTTENLVYNQNWFTTRIDRLNSGNKIQQGKEETEEAHKFPI